jgi:hypothetical protein
LCVFNLLFPFQLHVFPLSSARYDTQENGSFYTRKMAEVSKADLGISDDVAGADISAVHSSDDPVAKPTTLDRWRASHPIDAVRAAQRVGVVELVASHIDPCTIEVSTHRGWELLFDSVEDIPDGFVDLCDDLWAKIAFGGSGFSTVHGVHTNGEASIVTASEEICAALGAHDWTIPGIAEDNPATRANRKRSAGDLFVKIPKAVKLGQFVQRSIVDFPGNWKVTTLVPEQLQYVTAMTNFADAASIDWSNDVAFAHSLAAAKSTPPKQWVDNDGAVNKTVILCSTAGRMLVLAAIAMQSRVRQTDATRDAIFTAGAADEGGDSDDDNN